MPPSQGPLIPRRRLGHELKRLRESAGLQLVNAAKRLECSPSKVSRLENGQGLPKLRDVRDLLDLYQVRDQRMRTRLLNLATASQDQGWWSDLPDMSPSNLGNFISLESAADEMKVYTGFAIPGLIQTPEYTREIFSKNYPAATENEIEQFIEIRAKRQQLVVERLGELQITAVVDEGVLHRVVHSRAVMRAQLATLLDYARHDRVDLRIFPFSAGYNQGIQCDYAIFAFHNEIDQDTVYQELSGGDRLSVQETEVRRYSDIFTNLLSNCPDQESSRRLIGEIMEQNYQKE
ncbi:helix-turn-helix transcriptional regulator [Kutzneria buriramensis]|uniref:Helix-turn-helix protein n=1 Tax=Kutzneria buriramensis TaxID=1045776 RepID=A0A3E0IAB0_9PSEU|nr:helix-turn-helix transcriptional regulator [Kutzneria buriramensis]REH55673.1 helix-turn-helix protein [Kutzneria buriramensis]